MTHIHMRGNNERSSVPVSFLVGLMLAFAIDPLATSGVAGVVTARGGTLGGDGGSLLLLTPGDCVITTPVDVSASQGNGGSIDITSANLTLPPGSSSQPSLLANGGGNFNGGKITLRANLFGGGGYLAADAAGSGNGGTISLTSLSDVSVDGNLSLSAAGGSPGSLAGDGGSIILRSSGNLTVDPSALNIAPLGINGKGASVQLTAHSLQVGTPVNPDLVVDGAGLGGGGSVVLNNAGDFSVGQGQLSNSVYGTVQANAGSLGGPGGSIVIWVPGGKLIFPCSLTIDPGKPVSASLSTATSSGAGGTLSLRASDTIYISGGAISEDGIGGNYDGGIIILIAAALGLSGSSRLDLSANGSGSGNGGSISYNLPAQTINVDKTGDVTFSATGGSVGSNFGNGGSVTINVQDVTINPSYLNFGPLGLSGNGGGLGVNSSIGIVSRSSLSADGIGVGDGGHLGLFANTLSIGPGSVGVKGVLTANAGASGGNGGSISLSASTLSLTALTGLQANAPAGNGGSITVNGFDITTPGGLLGISAGLNGGTISVVCTNLFLSDLNPLSVDVSAPSSGGSARLDIEHVFYGGSSFDGINTGTGAGQIQVNASSSAGNGGTANLQTSGTLSVNSAADINVSPLGINGNGGSIFEIAGLLQVNGNVAADGVGNGIGGVVLVSVPGALTIGAVGPGSYISGNISASAGFTGSAGGSLTVSSSGAITVTNPGNINSVNAPSGSGGSIDLSASGSLNLPAGNLSVNGGSGSTNGGLISLSGQVLNLAGLDLSADGSGTGSGGKLQLSARNQSLTVSNVLSATSGVTGGNGGTLSLSASADLTVDASLLRNSPLGTNGNGGVINLFAGGKLLVTHGNLSADGKGSGSGGKIAMQSNSGSAFVIGNPTLNGVVGNVTANAPGSGTGGSISIVTAAPIIVNGLLSASSANGLTGTVTIPGALSPVSISGTGTILGALNTTNGAFFVTPVVSINLPGQSSPLTIGRVIAGGGITITVPSIFVPLGSSLVAGGSAPFQGQVTLNSASVVNNGLIGASFTNGFGAPNTGKVTIQNASGVTVSGTGYIDAPSIVFNSTNGSVLVNQSGLIGVVSGSARGAFLVQTATALSTASVLGGTASNASDGKNRVGIQVSLSSDTGIGATSTALQTDTVPRSASLRRDSKSDDKFVLGNTTLAFSVFVANDDSFEFTDAETEVSEVDGDVFLIQGKMVISSNESTKIVRTGQGNVTVNPDSIVIVEVAHGTLRAVSMVGDGQFQGKSLNSPVSIQKGQELLANEKGLEEEELIPADGIARGENIDAGLVKTTRTVVKRSISLNQLVSKDIMINGSLVHISGAPEKKHKEYRERVLQSVQAQSPFKSIAYSQSLRSPLATTAQSCLLLTSADCTYDQKNSVIDLVSGSLFVHPMQTMKIRTGLCSLQLEKGSCVNLSCEPSGKTIIRVCSGVRSARVLVSNKYSARLNAGEELSVSPGNVSAALNSDNIGHRNIYSARHAGLSFVHSEFSIPSLLNAVPHLSSLRHPANSLQKAAQARVLKSAVAVQMVRGRFGPYSNNAKP